MESFCSVSEVGFELRTMYIYWLLVVYLKSKLIIDG